MNSRDEIGFRALATDGNVDGDRSLAGQCDKYYPNGQVVLNRLGVKAE